MTWQQQSAVVRAGDSSWSIEFTPKWSSLQGIHGGIAAAASVRAAEAMLHGDNPDPAVTLRSATFGYAAGNQAGPADINVDLVRRGRNMSTLHTTMSQEGKTTLVSRLHFSSPWEGAEYSDAPSPPVRPAGTVRKDDSGRVSHISRVESHFHPDTQGFENGPRAEWKAWARPKDGDSFDSAWLVMFGDYFPPAVFVRSSAPSRAVTIEYAIQIHSADGNWTLADGEYLSVHMHTFHSHDGFAVEDGFIWMPDGMLLATCRQTRLAG